MFNKGKVTKSELKQKPESICFPGFCITFDLLETRTSVILQFRDNTTPSIVITAVD
jgi:hypothetical protein